MGDWLVRNFTVFGAPAQNWMLIALAIILIGLIGIAMAWWPRR
jgi:hypothetical protein